MNKKNTRMKVLRSTFLVTLALLVVQYIFGMIVNLYVQFPDSLPGGSAWGWSFTHTLSIPIHALLGTLLLVAALLAFIVSIMLRRMVPLLSSLLGLGMIIYAWLSGIAFLTYGQQNSVSLQMAIGFIGALVAYGVGYYVTRPNQKIIQINDVQAHKTPVAVR